MRSSILAACIAAVTALPTAQASRPPEPPRDSAAAVGPPIRGDGFIHLPGMLAVESDGSIVAPDSKTQCERILARASSVLDAAGSSLPEVATVTVFLRSQADYNGMNQALRTAWPTAPPARTTVMVEDLPHPGARVALSFVAVPKGADRRVITPETWQPMPYSYAIKSGGTLFLAGLVSRNPATASNVAGDITAQTKVALDNGAAVLAAAGMTAQDVVAAQVYVADPALLDQLNAVYRTHFPAAGPPRITAKAGFPSAQYLLEISLIAVDKNAQRGRVYIGGTTGVTDATKGDAAKQAREMLTRAAGTLKADGFGWVDVTEALIFVKKPGDAAAVSKAYRDVAGTAAPSAVVIGAETMNGDALVEGSFAAAKKQG